jgi:lipopolysaccharide export LptBFGC system permease protein LptF
LTILPRYLLRTFVPLFVLCLVLFTAVLLMNSFLKLFSLAVTKGISLVWILDCFARLLPYFMSLTVPMAFLVAMLMALGQLSERGEVMALRSSGFSFREMTWPLLALSVILSGLLLWVNHKVSPEGLHSFRKRQSRRPSSWPASTWSPTPSSTSARGGSTPRTRTAPLGSSRTCIWSRPGRSGGSG